MSQNPYAPPSAVVADVAPRGDRELADRGSRLAAAIVDGLLFTGCMLVVATFDPGSVVGWTPREPGPMLFAGVLALLVLFGTNIYLLHTRGQSLGKLLLKVRIVRPDGSRCDGVRLFGIRIIGNTILTMIPLVGGLYALADALFIFGGERRCLHDRLADTIVVKA